MRKIPKLPLEKFTRFEYIGPGGRLITLYGSFSLSVQDEGQTVKIFGDKPVVVRGIDE